ncbi:MAG: DUF5682 family protein [Candidatus Hodarchaeales archaeon]
MSKPGKTSKKRKKERDSILTSSPVELLEKINPPDSDIFYYPVRHHSPVCSFFLKQVIESFNPDIVLIEGPVDAEIFINDIVAKKTVPPVAIYTYFNDKNNKLGYNGKLTAKSDIPLRVTGWYPFAEFSPEYQAIKIALSNKKEVHFIDLPLSDKLKFEKEMAKNKDFFTKYGQWSESILAESSYVDRLLKKTGFRDFNEYWNHYFEVNVVTKELDDYLKQLLTFASILRFFSEQDDDFPTWKTVKEREKFMASQIAYWRSKNPEKRILVVTGAIHSVVLPFTKARAKTPKKPPKELTCALSPFSYTRISNLSGYISGIESPYYQNEIWKKLQKNDEDRKNVYNDTALQMLLEISRKLQQSNNRVSTADSINGYQMAKNLAAFRGSEQVTHDDLNDAIITTFVKGEIAIQGREILKITRELLTGNKVGRVFSSRGNPLEEDFYRQAKKLRIPVIGTSKKIRAEIYKRETHRQKSHFLHQTVFLDLGFARLEKGPNYIDKTNLELLSEQWKVRWSDSISTRLLELSIYGSTLSECAQALLLEKISDSYQSLEKMLHFLIFSLLMGFFDIFDGLMQELNARTGSGHNFTDLIKALSAGILLYNYRESLIPKHNSLVENFVYLTYTNSVTKLKDLVNLPDDQVEEHVMACRTLSAIAIESNIDLVSADLLVDHVERIMGSKVIIPQIEGAFTGILHSFNRISEIDVVNRFNGRAYSNEGAHSAAEFLSGLFMLNKTVLITSELLLQAINDSFAALPDDIFLEILPGLRKCFTSFIPREINYLAQKVSVITGLKPDISLRGIPAEVLNALQVLDQEINRSISQDWGL